MWSTARVIIFIGATGALLHLSRRSLMRLRTHGFFRFFVFEGTLVLILLNAPVWFVEPFNWHQLISWTLLLGSLPPLFMGVRELSRNGQADPRRRTDTELFGFERTSRLVSSGIFHYIRHPLYTSLLLLAWGACLKLPSLACVVIAAVTSAGVFMMSRLDEAECIQFFGTEYREYMRHSKPFVPHVI